MFYVLCKDFDFVQLYREPLKNFKQDNYYNWY